MILADRRWWFALCMAMMIVLLSGKGLFADDQCNTAAARESESSSSAGTEAGYQAAGNYEFRDVEERAAVVRENEFTDVAQVKEPKTSEGPNLFGLLGFFFRDQPQAGKPPQVQTDAGTKASTTPPAPQSPAPQVGQVKPPTAPAPEPTGPQADFFKKRGYIWNGKSWVKQPDPRYEEIKDPSTGEIIGIKTPDGKTVKPGERGYHDAEDALVDQKNADADKAWGAQVSAGQNADEDASKARTAEIRRARKAALEKMKDADPNVQAQGRAEWEALK